MTHDVLRQSSRHENTDPRSALLINMNAFSRKANAGGDPTTSPTLSDHIDQNIESIVELQRRELETAGAAQRWVETVGRSLGRPWYLLGLLTAIALWIGINVVREARGSWDPPPFELLGSVMTLISLITTTIILIAQNRQTNLEQQHTHLGLQVSLLTEQKVTKLINLIEELRKDLPMVKDRYDPHAEALQESADTAKVLAALEEGGATPSQKEITPGSAGPQSKT